MRRALAGCLIATFLCVGSASAESVSLGYKQFTGPNPGVFFAPDTLERAESFQILVTATPVQSLEYDHYISCTRGSETVASEAPDELITPPYAPVILPTMSEPDSCWITVSAESPLATGVPGTVRIEVTGNRRSPPPAAPPPVTSLPPAALLPYWKQCSLPGWLKSGEAKIHGNLSCAAGKRIVTKAWRKQSQDKHSVKASGYSCQRHELRGQGTIRCARGLNRIRVKGRLQ